MQINYNLLLKKLDFRSNKNALRIFDCLISN